MPIYRYQCPDCGKKVELLQRMNASIPLCCGKSALKQPTSPAIVRVKGGTIGHSKGYKEGYRKEYLKSTNREAWRDTIVSEPTSG